MASNDYRFFTRWRVRSTVQEVSEILGDASDLARWWPSVYLEVEVLEPGDARGIGKVAALYTKGWLPYTLRWKFRVTASDAPRGFSLEAFGDFVGRGVWTFTQDGEMVNVTYDWSIRADKPVLKYLSFLMKPLFSANHRWAMARGEESLKLELERRHAPTDADAARVPPPPGPTWPHRGKYQQMLRARAPELTA
jgi:Polyketide cyclase / dehydrase and lipid transport